MEKKSNLKNGPRQHKYWLRSLEGGEGKQAVEEGSGDAVEEGSGEAVEEGSGETVDSDVEITSEYNYGPAVRQSKMVAKQRLLAQRYLRDKKSHA